MLHTTRAARPLGRRALTLTHHGCTPTLAPTAFVAPTASVVGEVSVGAGASIWYGCVLRGDVAPIVVGERTNIQDGTVIHVASSRLGKRGALPTMIGDDVTVGHMALLHACTLGDRSFVGMGAIVMDGVVVESGAMVAAGALLTPGKTVRSGELWAGRPAKFFRKLSEGELKNIDVSAAQYVEVGQSHIGLE